MRRFVMKNKLFFGMIVCMTLAIGFMTVGCATNAGRFDSTTPPEADCVLVVGKTADTLITRFDNQTVSWLGKKAFVFFDGSFIIRVPAGEHMITGGNADSSGNLAFETSTKFTFVEGKAYDVSVVSRNFKITETIMPDNL
jgi:hypothetical protein